jgi:hypothetical protein
MLIGDEVDVGIHSWLRGKKEDGRTKNQGVKIFTLLLLLLLGIDIWI